MSGKLLLVAILLAGGLCMFAAILHVRSLLCTRWDARDHIAFHRGPVDAGDYADLSSFQGSVQLNYKRGSRYAPRPAKGVSGGFVDVWTIRMSGPGFAGFRLKRNMFSEGINLMFPHWLLNGAALVLLAFTTSAWRTNRRKMIRLAAGLCPKCGYDVRASSDRCSECGLELN